MLFAIAGGILLGVVVAVLSRTLIMNWIETDYNSREARLERYENYVSSLQTYCDRNGLSSENTAEINSWVRSNRNLYLFIYKDNQLFFDSSIMPDIDKNEKDEEEKGDNEPDNDGDNTADNDNTDGGVTDTEGSDTDGDTSAGDGTDGENPDTDGEEGGKGESAGKDNDKNDSAGGGITIEYPTRDEIIASAKDNGLLPLNLSDGTLFVSLADYTEYIYYDIANIVSIVSGVVVLTLVLMLYFQLILMRISRLAKDVSAVYEVDMATPIRTTAGNDELSSLTRNVEMMRSSMMQSLENEKQAINANNELITSMSHDIRTPLTILLGYIDMMKENVEGELMAEYVKASEKTALRLKELSDDMFRYFLLFGGEKLQCDIAEYDARTLFLQLFSEHTLLLRERGFEVELEVADSVSEGIMIKTDAPKIMRVADNLFSNICKYANCRYPVTVRLSEEDGMPTVTIKNSIKNEASKAESSGIGLKTCAKICDAVGVRFTSRCEREGEGDTFVTTLVFPR